MRSLALITTVFLVACTAYDQDAYVEQYVVAGTLVAGEPFPAITCSRTVPINQAYRAVDAAVRDAVVRVIELGASGVPVDVIQFSETQPGVYATSDAATVKPLTRYRLEVDIPGAARLVTGTTLVPDTFRVRALNSTTLPYQGAEQFLANLSASDYPGRQTYYVITTTALDTTLGMTPLYAGLPRDQRQDAVVTSSGVINAENYIALPDGSIELKYPWLALAYFGRNRVTFNAIDDNLYDFIRSASVQLGGSTTSPGEIENVISRLDGAMGYFGSVARAETEVTVTR
jgi:hypothetical protein